jgi:YwiC-like protein
MTTVALPAHPPRPLLRPLALPNEHGGWGFLVEPLLLGLLVRPSWAGGLVALAFAFGFLVRQPLRLALQDALRGRSYPRTRWCWLFAAGYASGALASLAWAIGTGGWTLIVPIGLVAPLGITQILHDAHNKGRALLPELAGAAAIASSAAAIVLADRGRLLFALALSGIIVARAIPSIVYVRSMLGRGAAWVPIALHAIAVVLVALFATKWAVAAMAMLFVRAAVMLARPAPPAKTIGWMEIVMGLVTVALTVIGYAT